jgi:hypothetical protein
LVMFSEVISAWNGPFHVTGWAMKEEQCQNDADFDTASCKFKSKKYLLVIHIYSIALCGIELPSRDKLICAHH